MSSQKLVKLRKDMEKKKKKIYQQLIEATIDDMYEYMRAQMFINSGVKKKHKILYHYLLLH